MDLSKLFEAQKKLDERIVEEKGLQGQDLLDEKILALQVELGELANELPEVFKFWSNKKNDYEKALKEYVDVLHFILSIGNDINLTGYMKAHNLTIHSFGGIHADTESIDFNNLFISIANFADSNREMELRILLIEFITLGESLGFTWDQTETAYYAKNKINHARQENGY